MAHTLPCHCQVYQFLATAQPVLSFVLTRHSLPSWVPYCPEASRFMAKQPNLLAYLAKYLTVAASPTEMHELDGAEHIVGASVLFDVLGSGVANHQYTSTVFVFHR